MNYTELFNNLACRYGEEFNWRQIPFSESTSYFVNELKKELGTDHIIFNQKVYSIAKNDSNDDVLFLLSDDKGNIIYRIYHLTYSSNNSIGYPKYEEFPDIKSLESFIEKQYIDEKF